MKTLADSQNHGMTAEASIWKIRIWLKRAVNQDGLMRLTRTEK